MRRRLCVSIYELSLPWKVMLDQIGIHYEEIDFQSSLIENYSCIILNSSLSESERTLMDAYIEQGGAVIDESGHNYFKDYGTHKTYKNYITNNSKKFSEQYLDIHSTLLKIDRKGFFNNAIYIEKRDEGQVCFLGLPINSLLVDTRYDRKQFYDEHELFPNEIVNKISKGKIRKTIEDLLVHLHQEQSLPFIKKSSLPTGTSSLLLFRVDTDFSHRQAIHSLYNLATKYEIAMTWFLHVEPHETWLDVFREMENQEIALHGYKHGTSLNYEKNKANIEKGINLLTQADIPFSGYCAPYGIWSNGLAQVMEEYAFEYASEFSLNYDDLPFYPILEDRLANHLQMPIHPVCIGSFIRKKATAQQMIDYFETYIEKQVQKNEHIVLYHHPLQGYEEVLEHIFSILKELGTTSLSFDDYSNFWKRRLEHNFEAFFENDVISITENSDQLSFEVVWKGSKGSAVIDNQLNLGTASLQPINWNNPLSEDTISKLNRKTFKLRKWSLLDWYRRERL